MLMYGALEVRQLVSYFGGLTSNSSLAMQSSDCGQNKS